MHNEGLSDGVDCEGQRSDSSPEGPGGCRSDDYSMPADVAEAIRAVREQSEESLRILQESTPLITRLIVRGLWADYRRQSGSLGFSDEGSGEDGL